MKTRFLDLLRAAQEGSRSGVLIASLPRNDPELARAALAGATPRAARVRSGGVGGAHGP